MTLDPTKLAGVREAVARELCRQDHARRGFSRPRIESIVEEHWREQGDNALAVLAILDAAPSSATPTERDKSRDEQTALSTQTQGGGENG